MIRGVHFVASNNIWAACEWGELLHFDGKMWHLIAGPSFAHNNAIFYHSDTSIWVASEYYNKRSISHWTGNHWINYDKGKAGECEEEDGRHQNYEKGLASLDYFFLFSHTEKNNFQPFIGINVGYANYESTGDIDMSGFVYGGQIGVLFSVAENIDVDLMYRYSLSNATQEDRDAELDHIGSIVFGINYVY